MQQTLLPTETTMLVADGVQRAPERAGRSGIYLITQSSERTRKQQNAVLFLMLQPMIKHEVTLNDCILSEPALQPNLVSVLLRFRARRIALMDDVEKMFLQGAL